MWSNPHSLFAEPSVGMNCTKSCLWRDKTIYEMERRGDFPRRFNLMPRCVVWDLEKVEAWIEERKRQSRSGKAASTSGPDVRQRIARPVRSRNN